MKKMRKSLVLILVFMLVLTLFVACNRGGDQGGNANNDQSQGDQGDGEQGVQRLDDRYGLAKRQDILSNFVVWQSRYDV